MTTMTPDAAQRTDHDFWHRSTTDHTPAERALVARIDLPRHGLIEYVDARRPGAGGQVVIVAVDSPAAERARFLVEVAGATPLEVFTALAPGDEPAPPRLLEDHLCRARADTALPEQPRALTTSAVFTTHQPVRTTFYEIYSDHCSDDPFGCAYPHTFWNHWAFVDTALDGDTLAIEDNITAPDGYGFIDGRIKRSLGLTYFSRHRTGTPLRVWLESGPDGDLPLIWSATFDEPSFVWFRTSQLAVTRGGTHLHWSGLSGAGNHVRLIGAWGPT
ncbi:hypothetical protein MCHIJ_07900 [Mycolicibacterium chitae]|uniref:Uncharacterized protein n=1 Tax=Mycolicibacterium chitae TaxID=1792 RepID=A0A448ICK6_MYCCI|nr:hypothetical protein [Mycolicibacterium chitae]MCV7104374.1 hypothetical protein [Mycolicibacterium chitae]BBZ01353.1 hypothetical protein MCHIJ_07900 [Mycolicibacterium chitae]VEG50190.1 Uncharacterised protein [Mycolicibacterium chitae]